MSKSVLSGYLGRRGEGTPAPTAGAIGVVAIPSGDWSRVGGYTGGGGIRPADGRSAFGCVDLFAGGGGAGIVREEGADVPGRDVERLALGLFHPASRYGLLPTQFEDALLLGMYFIVALLMGQLTTRIRAQEEAERLRQERATALYLLTRELNECASLDQIARAAISQMGRAFDAKIAVLLCDSEGRLQQPAHPAGTLKLTEAHYEAASRVLKDGRRAGEGESDPTVSKGLCVPLATSEGPVGVIAVKFGVAFSPTGHQLNMLDAFSQQIAFSLDRLRLREVSGKSQAAGGIRAVEQDAARLDFARDQDTHRGAEERE